MAATSIALVRRRLRRSAHPARGRHPARIIAVAIAVVAGTVALRDTGPAARDALVAVVVIALACAAGAFRERFRASRAPAQLGTDALELERRQEEQAGRVRVAERVRIARELHDIVAHGVSLMTLQAGAARRELTPGSRGADRSLELIESAGHDALAELRRLLTVLHCDGTDRARAERGPQLEDIPRLVDRVEHAGIPVDLQIEGYAGLLPASLERSAYRILQEALTNVMKHAPHADVSVVLRCGDDALELWVRDRGGGATPGRASPGGEGLAGMRERAAAIGGYLCAGPRAEGWLVEARLPIIA